MDFGDEHNRFCVWSTDNEEVCGRDKRDQKYTFDTADIIGAIAASGYSVFQ